MTTFTTSPALIILGNMASFFTLTSLTYYLALAMSSIFLLTPTAMNFAILGVIGLAYAINTVFEESLKSGPSGFIASSVCSPVIGLLGSIIFAIPFFIAIACGAPTFITTSYLSWSAANISILTLCALGFLGGVISLAANHGGLSISSSEFNGGGQYKSFNTPQSQSCRFYCNPLI